MDEKTYKIEEMVNSMVELANEEVRKLEGLLAKYEMEITKKIQNKDFLPTYDFHYKSE